MKEEILNVAFELKTLSDNVVNQQLSRQLKSLSNILDKIAGQMQAPVIVKLAEKRKDKLWDDKVKYIKDNCDDIVEDIEDEIQMLEKLIDGLNYYMGNVSKFSE